MLPMYDFYESFYKRTAASAVFERYCEEVFGADFSQDGFSNMDELNDLIKKVGIGKENAVLDLGCGSGGICGYIHAQTGASVCGLDYSEAVISLARERFAENKSLRFDVGAFGETEYPPTFFDAVISIDTMYFARDTEAFLWQIYGWLKPGGALAVMYGCYDRVEPDIGRDDTSLAKALRKVDFAYEAEDYTESYFNLMRRKRAAALGLAEDFRREGLGDICGRIITESVDPDISFNEFSKHYSRYMYIIRKESEG